ncbi:hypothetical protein [Haliangium sp.]|uniref:hypothetical protein n=1 Tax=Haliangium sp. TaxID=2663208 RepID=UPI003D0CAD5E
MNYLIRICILVAAATVFAGCQFQTSFAGAPHVPNGAAGCRTMCIAQGMQLAGMVFMGEYSDGCVCVLPGQNAAEVVSRAGAAAGSAAAGVRMQMSAAEAQRRQQQQMHTTP